MITDHIAAAVVRTMGISEDVFCERVHKLLTLSSRLSFSLGVDGPASNSKELEHAFSHACDALNDRFFGGPGRSAGTGQLRANTRISGKK